MIRAVFFVAAGLVAFADPDVAPSPPAELTPEAIYLRSVAAMKNAPLPPYVAFRENVSGRNFRVSCSSDGIDVSIHHGDASGAYDVYVRTSDGSAVSQDVVDAKASPCPAALLIPAGSAISGMGVPQASASPDARDASSESAVGGPPIIGAVRVNGTRYYHIDLAGRESLDGNDVYHLRLHAYHDPDTHPLTDLFVDPATFLVREACGEASAHFVVGSGRVAGVVDFDRVGDYWLVKRERFDVAANAFLVHARMSADLMASNMTTPSNLPGIAFPMPTPSPSATPSPRG